MAPRHLEEDVVNDAAAGPADRVLNIALPGEWLRAIAAAVDREQVWASVRQHCTPELP